MKPAEIYTENNLIPTDRERKRLDSLNEAQLKSLIAIQEVKLLNYTKLLHGIFEKLEDECGLILFSLRFRGVNSNNMRKGFRNIFAKSDSDPTHISVRDFAGIIQDKIDRMEGERRWLGLYRDRLAQFQSIQLEGAATQ